MKPTCALLIAIAAFVIDPWTSSLALAQSRAESPAGIQPQDRAQDNVLAYHGGAGRSGNFTVPGLTWERARSLHLDQAFQARISGNVYAQPLFWRTPGSNTGRLLVATEDNNVYALDATTGHLIWARS
jgi:outer membrane protein assembly factor BamB